MGHDEKRKKKLALRQKNNRVRTQRRIDIMNEKLRKANVVLDRSIAGAIDRICEKLSLDNLSARYFLAEVINGMSLDGDTQRPGPVVPISKPADSNNMVVSDQNTFNKSAWQP